jgi:hypothetical protein
VNSSQRITITDGHAVATIRDLAEEALIGCGPAPAVPHA